MKSKILVVAGALVGLILLSGIFEFSEPQVAGTKIEVLPSNPPVIKPSTLGILEPSPIPTQISASAPLTIPSPKLSNNNHYINSQGNNIHSPAYSNDGSIPEGATAICGDGTYSFSQHRRGTCSHHGGVAQWL